MIMVNISLRFIISFILLFSYNYIVGTKNE